MLRRESDYSERNRVFPKNPVSRWKAARQGRMQQQLSTSRHLVQRLAWAPGRLFRHAPSGRPEDRRRPPAQARHRPPRRPPQDDDYLVDELLQAFRQLPDDWKQDALAEVEIWARLAPRQGIRISGAAGDTPSPQGRDRSSGQPEGQRG